MSREEYITELYNVYYTEAQASGRGDIDAGVWAYEQACNDLESMNRQELRLYLKRRKAA